MATLADDAINTQGINRMLDQGTSTAQMFNQQMLRMNADDQSDAVDARRTHKSTTQLITYLGAQGFLGEAPVQAAATLAYRAIRDQPQTTGQQTSAPPYVVPTPGYGNGGGSSSVYVYNPTTGTITKGG